MEGSEMNSEMQEGELEVQPANKRLKKAAIALFTERGYAATTVREVVEAAGVTKPVLYYYFKSKEGIYIDILNDTAQRLEELLQSAKELKGSYEEILLQFCDLTIRKFMEEIDVVRMMHSIFYGPPQGAPFYDFEVFHTRLLSTFESIISQGIQAGEFIDRNPAEMALVVFAVVNIVFECELTCSKNRIGLTRLGDFLAFAIRGLKSKI
jgi:TetR/AcrR family transcriptional regulator